MIEVRTMGEARDGEFLFFCEPILWRTVGRFGLSFVNKNICL